MATLQPSVVRSKKYTYSLQHNKNVENVLYLYAAMGFHPIGVSIDDKGVRRITISNGSREVLVTLDVKSVISYQKILDNAVEIGKTLTRTCGGNARIIPQNFRGVTNDQELLQLTADVIMRQCSNQFGKFDNNLAMEYCHILDTTIIGNKAYSWHNSPIMLEQYLNEPDSKKKEKATAWVSYDSRHNVGSDLQEVADQLYALWDNPQSYVSRWTEKYSYTPSPEKIVEDEAFFIALGENPYVRGGK